MPYSSTLISRSTAIAKNWPWLLAWGVVLILLGFFAISLTTLTTIVSVMILGIVIFIAGIILFIDAFKFWSNNWLGFLIHILLGILYVVVGFFLIQSPLLGSISLTLFLGVFYLVAGIFRTLYALSSRLYRWVWVVFSGIISIILGLLILSSWPASGVYIIGLFVGIDLLFIGWAYVMIALSLRGLIKPA